MKKLLALIVLFVIAASILSLMQYFKNPRPMVLAPVEENPGSGRVMSPEEVTLKIGETKEVVSLKIILNDLIDDYRCGADALCPEFGGVTVNVTLDSGTETVTRNMASDEVPLEFSGYRISIPRMAPTKFADQVISKSEYEITFLVAPVALDTLNENPGL